MIVLAHAGHWAVQLLYVMPLVIMVGALVVGRVRQRRKSGNGRDGDVQP